jgi:hypothetical protein
VAGILVQFERLRRRRWLIRAQGWSTATTLGSKIEIVLTLKGFGGRETLSGLSQPCLLVPGFGAQRQPWAELANAFGVLFQTEPNRRTK